MNKCCTEENQIQHSWLKNTVVCKECGNTYSKVRGNWHKTGTISKKILDELNAKQ